MRGLLGFSPLMRTRPACDQLGRQRARLHDARERTAICRCAGDPRRRHLLLQLVAQRGELGEGRVRDRSAPAAPRAAWAGPRLAALLAGLGPPLCGTPGAASRACRRARSASLPACRCDRRRAARACRGTCRLEPLLAGRARCASPSRCGRAASPWLPSPWRSLRPRLRCPSRRWPCVAAAWRSSRDGAGAARSGPGAKSGSAWALRPAQPSRRAAAAAQRPLDLRRRGRPRDGVGAGALGSRFDGRCDCHRGRRLGAAGSALRDGSSSAAATPSASACAGQLLHRRRHQRQVHRRCRTRRRLRPLPVRAASASSLDLGCAASISDLRASSDWFAVAHRPDRQRLGFGRLRRQRVTVSAVPTGGRWLRGSACSQRLSSAASASACSAAAPSPRPAAAAAASAAGRVAAHLEPGLHLGGRPCGSAR